jgi:hypothetical protein
MQKTKLITKSSFTSLSESILTVKHASSNERSMTAWRTAFVESCYFSAFCFEVEKNSMGYIGKKFYGTWCHRNLMAATWIACHVERESFFFLAHVTYKILGDVLLFLIWQSRDKIFSPKGSLVLTSPSTLHANIPFLHDCYICMLVLEKKRYVMFQRELIVCTLNMNVF